MVLVYRSIFLSSEKKKKKGLERIRRKKYKAIDRLEGIDYEEALENLAPEERDGFLVYSDKNTPTSVFIKWGRTDKKVK